VPSECTIVRAIEWGPYTPYGGATKVILAVSSKPTKTEGMKDYSWLPFGEPGGAALGSTLAPAVQSCFIKSRQKRSCKVVIFFSELALGKLASEMDTNQENGTDPVPSMY
jgi:hypothetical protein